VVDMNLGNEDMKSDMVVIYTYGFDTNPVMHIHKYDKKKDKLDKIGYCRIDDKDKLHTLVLGSSEGIQKKLKSNEIKKKIKSLQNELKELED